MKNKLFFITVFFLFFYFLSSSAFSADLSMPALTLKSIPGSKGSEYSLSLQALILMTFLAFIPALIMMMTSFTRIIIVLSILRQALGLPQTPTNQVLIGISIFLSFFIMEPVWQNLYEKSLSPYFENKMSFEAALDKGQKPIREFMLSQTREDDIFLFVKMSGKKYKDLEAVPFSILMPAYLTSELKTAFQIGFLIFIPFLIVDLIVASILMAMGMMMLSPMMISLPFKIMLFVLVDGWSLVFGTLARSFGA